jgi:hypothetical protein
MTKIRGVDIEPRKLGRGKPRLNALSNDFNLHSFVEANAVSGETVGAGPFGTVVVGDLPAGPFTHTRFLETRRQVNFVPLTVFVKPTFLHELVAALVELVGATSERASAPRATARRRLTAESVLGKYQKWTY